MMATLDIRKRVKRSKADADKIAARTQTISAGIAQPVPLQRSIDDFNVHLIDIRSSVEPIARSNTISRLLHLNHNERTLTDGAAQLTEVHTDFLVGSVLRGELLGKELLTRQEKLEIELAQTTNACARLEAAAASGFRQKIELELAQMKNTCARLEAALDRISSLLFFVSRAGVSALTLRLGLH
ncbi:hypothetical protein C8R46DRAFT_605298 [Mycena filopes]|nr:hypothetical protein C8R46DRAFT_605298 [Mycena filopes]